MLRLELFSVRRAQLRAEGGLQRGGSRGFAVPRFSPVLRPAIFGPSLRSTPRLSTCGCPLKPPLVVQGCGKTFDPMESFSCSATKSRARPLRVRIPQLQKNFPVHRGTWQTSWSQSVQRGFHSHLCTASCRVWPVWPHHGQKTDQDCFESVMSPLQDSSPPFGSSILMPPTTVSSP